MITPSRPRIPAISLLVLAMAGASFARPAAAADEAIVASLSPPQSGLACEDAAARTSVYFQFAHPSFAVSQISLYLDGKGVPNEAIEQHWPTVTLSQGLHVGRNTVDIVAEGRGGQRLSRRLVVLVGPAAGGDATVPATVPCDDALASGYVEEGPPGTIEEPQPVIVENPAPIIVEQPPVVYQQPPVIVEGAPVYVYRPYPLFALDAFVPLVPFFGFSFFYSNYHPYCPPPRVVYHTAPDYRWGGRDRWHDARGWQGRAGEWHERNGGGAWRGGAYDRPHDDQRHARGASEFDHSRGDGYRPTAPGSGWRPAQPPTSHRDRDAGVGDRRDNGWAPNGGGYQPAREQPSRHGGGYLAPPTGGVPGHYAARPGGGHGGERGGHQGGNRGGEQARDHR